MLSAARILDGSSSVTPVKKIHPIKPLAKNIFVIGLESFQILFRLSS
jgi:hypothetical protein